MADDSTEAIPGNAQVKLAWADPSDSAITKWQYRKKVGITWDAWTDVPGSGATTTEYTVTGLTNGRSHKFEVRAFTTTAQTALDTVTVTPTHQRGLEARLRQRRGYGRPTLSVCPTA